MSNKADQWGPGNCLLVQISKFALEYSFLIVILYCSLVNMVIDLYFVILFDFSCVMINHICLNSLNFMKEIPNLLYVELRFLSFQYKFFSQNIIA